MVAKKKKVAAPSDRGAALREAIDGLEGFRLWSDVTQPLILPTCITSLNRATCCGGIPGGQVGVLHGPSNGGKSLLAAEILRAAKDGGASDNPERYGWGAMIDAENRAVDKKWYSAICGDLSQLFYDAPKTYEAAIAGIAKIRNRFRTAKNDGKIGDQAMLAVVVDSVNRLTPQDELEQFLKDNKVKAREFPLRALLTSKWLDKLTPTLEPDEIIVLILRESRRLDAKPGQRTWQVKTGNTAQYDAGWVARVTAPLVIKEGAEGKQKAVAQRHEVDVMKNSMGAHVEKSAWFYSSVGADGGVTGLDRAREIREEMLIRKILVDRPKTKDRDAGYYLGEERICRYKSEITTWLKDKLPEWIHTLNDGSVDAKEFGTKVVEDGQATSTDSSDVDANEG